MMYSSHSFIDMESLLSQETTFREKNIFYDLKYILLTIIVLFIIISSIVFIIIKSI
jgi:hypothetical protein